MCHALRNIAICFFPHYICIASQMWCLARLLPLMTGDSVPEHDAHWENFNLMLSITDYAFAPVTSEEIIPYL